MSVVDVQNELTNMQTQNAIYQAAQEKETGAAQQMDGDMFMKLMLEQLKYQDPTSPMDNTEFLSQQAQFTQVETLENISDSLTQNNSIMQTLSLVGKDVTLTDPDNSKNTISGIVDEANFSSDTASITVGGKSYPISLIQSVRDVSATANNSGTTTSGS